METPLPLFFLVGGPSFHPSLTHLTHYPPPPITYPHYPIPPSTELVLSAIVQAILTFHSHSHLARSPTKISHPTIEAQRDTRTLRQNPRSRPRPPRLRDILLPGGECAPSIVPSHSSATTHTHSRPLTPTYHSLIRAEAVVKSDVCALCVREVLCL